MAPALPIKFQELLQLSSLGVNPSSITFNTCVCLTKPQAPMKPSLPYGDLLSCLPVSSLTLCPYRH